MGSLIMSEQIIDEKSTAKFQLIVLLLPADTSICSSGASGLHLTKHENFHGGLDAISVGDGLFTILTTLSKRATSVQVMLQPILTYMACGYMGRQVSIRLWSTGIDIKMCLEQIIMVILILASQKFTYATHQYKCIALGCTLHETEDCNRREACRFLSFRTSEPRSKSGPRHRPIST